MVTFYFDTSAIVKRYRKEIGSEVLDKIFELKGHAFTISFWCILEFIVAFSARMRREKLSRKAFNAVVSRFLKDVLDRFAVTSVNDELVASATPLAVKHALPSADCLQLANAISLKKALEPMKEEFILVC
ncbi:MAG: type II toxin-antitoxin system VapC family toxin [Candidatus Bathyarchaeia archaeon]